MVLDGMGGHCRGDAASHLAMEIISEKMLNTDKFLSYSSMKATLLKTIKKANKEVNLLGSSKLEYLDMGTTLCLVAIRKDKTLLFDFVDDLRFTMDGRYEDNYMWKHYKERKKIYKEQNFPTYEQTISFS